MIKPQGYNFKQGSIYWGEASAPQTPQLPQKSFPPKKIKKLFQLLIWLDDDFKESVKITNTQKCDFSQ